MEDNILLKTTNIHKIFPGVYALKKVDFELLRGEVHALLGENGAGKSTLIKIIGGIYNADKGKVLLEGKEVNFHLPKDAIESGISIIYQEFNLSPNLSIAENIYHGRLPQRSFGMVNQKLLFHNTRNMMKKVGLNINPSTKVRYLSVAQQQLVEIAKALSLKARILIMDEPTSSLSPNEIEILFGIIRELKAQGIGIIYVSHKLEELFAVCDRVTVLRDGQKIDTLNIKDTDKDQLINLMVGRKIQGAYIRDSKVQGDTFFKVSNLTNSKLTDVSFEIRKGEILGFSGLMGAGKTEIARALFGLDSVVRGTIEIEGEKLDKWSPQICKDKGIGFVPEDRKTEGLFTKLSVKENMTISTLEQFSDKRVIKRNHERKSVLEQIAALSIKTPSLKQKISNLSGGNQQKVILSRWLLNEDLKILIIDEPTRGIDVGAKFEIYQILNKLAGQGVAIIIMSSEIKELVNICDRIIVLREGIITGRLSKEEASQENIMRYAIS